MSERLPEYAILEHLTQLARQPGSKDRLLFETVKLLKDNFPNYNWVGIYNLEFKDELVLGPFLGKPSPHTRIKIDSGICGAAAREGETIIVDDVNDDNRYLACSIETRSEIVVPIFKNGVVVGEIDIDSDIPAAFGDKDRRFLEQVSEIISAAY